MIRSLLSTLFSLIALVLSSPLHAQKLEHADTIDEFFSKGNLRLLERYRYENVDDEAFVKDARASTLRSALRLSSAEFFGFDAVLEAEDVREIGDDRFNNTINGRTDLPVVADVESSEFHQSFLRLSGIPESSLSLGRRAFNLDNERFVGEVGWRQLNQSFDAATFESKPLAELQLFYSYVYNVNRIFGEESPVGDYDSDSHLLNARYALTDTSSLGGYMYALDFENATASSNASTGLRLAGKEPIGENLKGVFELEYAYQEDFGDNETNYEADYFLASAGLEVFGVTLKGAYELLGSDDGVAAVQTPLATLHRHNGWADKFLTTPATGLVDTFTQASYTFQDCHWFLDSTALIGSFHSFSADSGSDNYGSEWDFDIVRPLDERWLVGLRYANYDAQSFGTDTEKIIFTLQFTFESWKNA